jgi:hypothetical protein
MKYTFELGSGAMICTTFHKYWFRHSKLNRGDSQAHRHTGTQHGDSINLILIFQSKESRLEITFSLIPVDLLDFSLYESLILIE